jgi:hypothetical protein
LAVLIPGMRGQFHDSLGIEVQQIRRQLLRPVRRIDTIWSVFGRFPTKGGESDDCQPGLACDRAALTTAITFTHHKHCTAQDTSDVDHVQPRRTGGVNVLGGQSARRRGVAPNVMQTRS